MTTKKIINNHLQLTDMTKLTSVLMCNPLHFSVEYQINPWMKPGTVDKQKAMEQWQQLKSAYEAEGISVQVIDQVPGQPDMVFAADQGLVITPQKHVLMSSFRYPQRMGETDYYSHWFREHGYVIEHLPKDIYFEGGGELLPWKNGFLIGEGFRNSAEACKIITRTHGTTFISLELIDPQFYHLDTCLFALSDSVAFYYKPAFSELSCAKLRDLFDELVEFTEQDVLNFAANSVISGTTVFCNTGCDHFVGMLRNWGYKVVECDISEFMKSGGGIHCLTFELERVTISKKEERTIRNKAAVAAAPTILRKMGVLFFTLLGIPL